MVDWAESLSGVGDHWHDSILVHKLIGFGVVLKNHTNSFSCGEKLEGFGWEHLLAPS